MPPFLNTNKMKVKLLKEWAGLDKGAEVTLHIRIATIWINKGVAEKVVNKPSFNKKQSPKNKK